MAQNRTYLLDNEALWRTLWERRMRTGKLIFGILALVMIILGLGVYIFSSTLGIDPQTAKLIAVAFLIAGVMDYLVLHFWDRIYPNIK